MALPYCTRSLVTGLTQARPFRAIPLVPLLDSVHEHLALLRQELCPVERHLAGARLLRGLHQEALLRLGALPVGFPVPDDETLVGIAPTHQTTNVEVFESSGFAK